MKKLLHVISTGVANTQAWLQLIASEQYRTNQGLENIMSRFDDALAGHVAYEDELKAQRDDLRRHLQEAVDTNQQLRDTDAAEDAAQAAALEDALAAKLEEALARAKEEPAPPAPAEEPAPPAEEPAPPADVPAEPVPDVPAPDVPADPVVENPAPAEEAPAEPAPAEEAPADGGATVETPVGDLPVDQPADQPTVEDAARDSGDPFFQ